MSDLTDAELLKFQLFAVGLNVTESARERLFEVTSGRAATPADYASTSGLILALDDDVWVNAPIIDYNPSMIGESACILDLVDGRFWVTGASNVRVPAAVWVPPTYHNEANSDGEPFTAYAYTHSDRVRIAPIEGCSMRCRFCDLPYKYPYRKKTAEQFVAAVERALTDPLQPAGHVLISGGTPTTRDIDYVRDVYDRVFATFPDTPIDIMMAPIGDLLDPEWLSAAGVNEISVNIELTNDSIAKRLMPQKHRFGLPAYLSYMEKASNVLGPNRVRSMVMVGLEPLQDTLAGVRLIAERGCVPVLSPFRPDPSTPLADLAPMDANGLVECYLRARDITDEHGVSLGPACIPCSHNTMTLAASGHGQADRYYLRPNLV